MTGGGAQTVESRRVEAFGSSDPARLQVLAADPDSRVRLFAAGNQSTPPGALAVLAVDPDPVVREAAGGNPLAPRSGRAAAGLLND